MSPRLTLLNADARKYAPFIVKALYHEHVAGTSLSALSETEKAINGDNWYWTDDNAKSLEALTLPSVFPAFATQVGQLVKFIVANSPPPFVFRRRAEERLELLSDKPEDFRVVTGLMNFHGNLREAEVKQGYRFHDDRNEDAVRFSADFVRFSVGGQEYTEDIKQFIDGVEIHREPRNITLVHRSALRAAKGVVGHAVYSYSIEIDKPYLTVSLAIQPNPGTTLENVQATTSIDQLPSASNIRYSKFFAFAPGISAAYTSAGESSKPRTLWEGSTPWWALVQASNLGNSYAIATILNTPESLRDIVSTEEQSGSYPHIRSTFIKDEVRSEHPLIISERRALLAGGLFNDMRAYAGVFSKLDQFPGLDLSISYDIGAELNGVAAAFLADKRRLAANPTATPVAYTAEIRAWFDAILDGYESGFVVKIGQKYPYIFSRGAAFTLMAADTMFVATGEKRYLEAVRRLADVLLTFQVKRGNNAGAFICNGNDAFMDCHASGIIAMARAAIALKEKRYAGSVMRALNAYHTDEDADTGNDVYIHIRAHGSERDSYYWIYKAGLLLRSLEAAELLTERGLLNLNGSDWDKIQDMQARAVQYIARTVHAREELDELFTCHKSSETNSETQAWALLGLHRVEHERTEGR